MKKDESKTDRLMDNLLREDAKGGADEEFLAELEGAFDAASRKESGTLDRDSTSPWMWRGAAVAACLGLSAVVVHQMGGTESDLANNERGDRSLTLEGAKNRGSKPPAPDVQAEGKSRPGTRVPLLAEWEGQDPLKAPSSPIPPREPRPDSEPTPSNPPPLIALVPQNESPSSRVPIRPSVHPKPKAAGPVAKIEGSKLGDFRRKKFGIAPPAESGHQGLESEGGFSTSAPKNTERYGQLIDQPWKSSWDEALSTFSVDVDTASYTNIRRMLRSGAAIPKDSVRLEEAVNYFNYRYPGPREDGPFAVHVEMASCPWEAKHHLVKIGLKGKEVDTNNRPPSNLVFLIDVSGSMNRPNKLPLLVESMKVLVEELDERDSVGIVVYAGQAGTLLSPTKVVGNGRTEILSALENLRAGGSTAGAAGLSGAYELAAKHYHAEGVNRVILASDGDFNVGMSSNGALVDLVKEKAKSGVFLSVLGFGTGNLNDSMMEAITNEGNGNYFYIDTIREGRKVFMTDLSGTLVTIAKDVKIQVEFNPGKVAGYRLIGYANRILPPEAFNDDKVDAGEIGAGHTVTALYEVVPVGVEVPKNAGVDRLKYQKPANRAAVESPEWMTVKLRYKAPNGDKSTLLEVPVKQNPGDWTTASGDFQFAAGVALFGEKLRGSDKVSGASWDLVAKLATKGKGDDVHGHRAEFLELVSLAAGKHSEPDPAEGNIHPQPVLEAPHPR